jgi:hypothetical protein
MVKTIDFLGTIRLPWKKLWSTLESKSTIVEQGFDPGIHKNRSEQQITLQNKIFSSYTKKSQEFTRYLNPEFTNLIPKSAWDQLRIKKEGSKLVVIKHGPGTFTTPHVDTYNDFIQNSGNKNNNNSRNKVRRVWISLTDPKVGHALFVGDKVAYFLKKGSALTFNHKIYHSACNAGWEDRYILTITAWYNGK